MLRTVTPAIFAFFCLGGGVHAAPAKIIGNYNQWNVATSVENGQDRCFISSKPSSLMPSNLNHGEVLFFVKTRDKPPSNTESSFKAGYNFAKDSDVRVTIGDETFQMFTSGDSAWLRRLEREDDLLRAMKSGDSMVVDATSARGNATSYVFSLDGVSAASSRIFDNCP
jgi:hypothetical protein